MSMKKMKTFAVNGEQFEIMDEYARNNNNDTNINNFIQNNLLINSNFANPVNQKGFTTATGNYATTYTIDGWFIQGSDATLMVTDGCLVLYGNENITTASGLYQRLEGLPKGKYSLSAKVNGKVYTATLDWNDAYTDKIFKDGVMLLLSNTNLTDGVVTFGIGIQNDKISSANIEWAKLELGDHATPYVPRLFSEELQLCKRYYYTTYSTLGGTGYLGGISENGQSIALVVEFPVEMRAIPTVTIKSPIDGSVGYVAEWTGMKNVGNGDMIAGHVTSKQFFVTSATPRLTKGTAYYFAYEADARL